ncbi:MAG: DUF3108 domain-containing protein [Deltaproteobacteria bacterium]|nr:MAG: DUF3108 domain-containing protein [Deltaproteobacteria bacterium]
MLPMLALLLAALCPTQKLPAVRSTAPEVLHYRLDALGADVGTFEIRAEPPPASERSRTALRLSSRAKTSAFVSTNLGRFETYATALVARDFTPLHYREDLDENDVHRGVELLFPPLNGTLAVKATKNGEPEPLAVELTDNVRDMISTLYLLRLVPMNQPVCLEVFAGRKVWKLTGQLTAKESIDTPLGRFMTIRFDGDAVRTDDPKIRRTAHVWMTDDERRLPLVAIGDVRGKTIRAQLVSAPGLRRAAKK